MQRSCVTVQMSKWLSRMVDSIEYRYAYAPINQSF